MSKLVTGALFAAECAVILLAVAGRAHALTSAVPEIDAGMATSGVALLAGSVLFLLERMRRR